ncbi:hypothetical protein ESA94_13755 [Lacibacter luteus]|uniref:Uncharacterized protein n=1 Tax=Lacibacter luteus TaxID=2508719 RepID=A0A4Q1CH30_9BACT|nr:hypothetical protein [Lacibacter luteus]RXK59201.1 hypothetical protein ESA94_13755 [Lacibacter luteus]
MNYIRHLNAFFTCIKTDDRLSSSHVSLYMALFQYWNFNRFGNPFSIYRENIMQLSKLSKNTYHKCVKELHEAKYIYYHPSASKFQAVRISIVRLDKEEEPKTRYHQLDLFDIAPGDIAPGFSPRVKSETGRVANLRPSSTNTKTDTVSNMGHIIKPNSKTENSVTNTPNSFDKPDRKRKKETGSPRVLKSIPAIAEIEAYFRENNYPVAEAHKFFHYNNAKNWMLTDKIPITNWQSLALKWMLNPVTENSNSTPAKPSVEEELSYLYESFLEGNKIFHQVTAEHFKHLALTLGDDVLNKAWAERINQLTGTNQHSLSQLWQAYQTNDPSNPLVQQDKPNFILLAKRIAVIKHFYSQKNKQHEH